VIVWLAVFIPVLTALVLYVWFKHQSLWWEFAIPFAASICLIAGGKSCAVRSQTADTEYWGSYLTQARYYEDWNKYIHQTCTRRYACGSDSQGHTRYCTQTYDCSYVAYYPEYWEGTDSIGQTLGLGQAKFEELAVRWGNRTFQDMNRPYHTNDGDMYFTNWNSLDTTLEPIVTEHAYENRPQAAKTVFSFPEVKNTCDLYGYPTVSSLYTPSVLGDPGPDGKSGVVALDHLNAILGPSKEVRVWVLTYKNLGQQTSFDQENYWRGGNKNELVITVGVDDNYAVQWARAFSWSDHKDIEVEAKSLVLSQKTLSLTGLAASLAPIIEAKWHRKDFDDFAYLTIDPSPWATVLIFTLTALINIGLSTWIVMNEFSDEPRYRRY
jgi:hypothetical protein